MPLILYKQVRCPWAFNQVFPEMTGVFHFTQSPLLRCRMRWVNVSQASSSSRSFLALLVHLLPGILFSAGSVWNAAEITKGKYCWVSGYVHRGHWSWWRWRFPFSFSWLEQSRCLGKLERWRERLYDGCKLLSCFFLCQLFSSTLTLSLCFGVQFQFPHTWGTGERVNCVTPFHLLEEVTD